MNLEQAIQKAAVKLANTGYLVQSKNWQGQQLTRPMYETLNTTITAIIPDNKIVLKNLLKPNLPWADDHFDERVGGIPLNPPPSASYWASAKKDNADFKEKDTNKFSHTYPERFWPKFAGKAWLENLPENDDTKNRGIRYDLGDLNDLINLMVRDPETRQAFLPIFFPEDTGAVHGGRIPCTLGYHFIIRHGIMHIIYHMRSCDFFRHMRDDIYMAIRLGMYIRDKIQEALPEMDEIPMGTFTMHIASLHIFDGEQTRLAKEHKLL